MANSVGHARLPYPIKNARYTVGLGSLDADGDPTDVGTPDTEISQDGGAFADATEEVTTISGSNGSSYITLTGAETNNSLVMGCLKVSSGPKATLFTIYPRDLPILESGTAGAGAAGTLTLASGTYTGLNLAGCFLRTTGGTGGGGTGGANNQARRIVSYNTGTRVATVAPNWETTPDATTTYDILLPEGVLVPMLTALAPTTLARTLDVSSGGEAGVDWANVGSPTTTNNLSGTSTKAVEPTVAGRTLDVSAGGEAGVDWANVGTPGSTVNLSATTVKTATDVETDTQDIQGRLPAALVSGRIDSSVGAYASGQAPLQPTTAGRTLDVTATGGAGIDWSNVENPTTTLALTGTTISTSQVAASVTGAVGSVTGSVGSVTGSIGSLGATAKSDVNDQVVDALATDTYPEPGQGTPAATLSLAAKINYLFKSWRNKKDQSSTAWKLYGDDATTVDQKSTVADDGSTATKGEITTGP